MGEIVPLLPDPAADQYAADIHEVCRLAGISVDRADLYIRQRAPREVVMSDAIFAVFGKRLPGDDLRHMHRLIGPAGTCRRNLPFRDPRALLGRG